MIPCKLLLRRSLNTRNDWSWSLSSVVKSDYHKFSRWAKLLRLILTQSCTAQRGWGVTYRRSWSRRRAVGCPCEQVEGKSCQCCCWCCCLRHRLPPQQLPQHHTCTDRTRGATERFWPKIKHDTPMLDHTSRELTSVVEPTSKPT